MKGHEMKLKVLCLLFLFEIVVVRSTLYSSDEGIITSYLFEYANEKMDIENGEYAIHFIIFTNGKNRSKKYN